VKSFFTKSLKGDRIIWIVIVGLLIFSLLAVYSSTGTLAYKYKGGNTAFYIMKHSTIVFVGLIIIFITHLIHYKYYSRISQVFLFLAVPLLAITLLIGTNINQASRWLTLPGLGFTIQTSDFAKLALIMYVARILSLKQEVIKDYKQAFIPIMIPVVIVCLLILPANLSTALIVFATSMVLMFVGRIRIKHLFVFGGVGILTVALFVVIAVNINKEGRIGTWKNRIENFVGGDGSENYQVEQSKIAIATGGIIPKGPGNSVQRNYLPNPYSDFIYAIIIEEWGLIGGIVVLLLYLILLFRAGVIVRKSTRTFPAFLAIGLTLSIVFQAMINMAVAVNLFPVTGQPLPFISMGGSSLVFTSIAMGIILSVSTGVNKANEYEAVPE